MTNQLNRLIAEALNVEHVAMQIDYFKEEIIAQNSRWITLLDGDEIWGEDFPKDWEHDLNAAVTLLEDTGYAFSELRYDSGAVNSYRWSVAINAHHPSNEVVRFAAKPAEAICLAWLQAKGLSVEAVSG